MQPIGRRRRWRDFVGRAQFNAQLRQLSDPVAGDNIGMALTEATESSDPPIILSILPSRLTGSPTPIKRPILPWGSFCNAQLDWMRCWPRWQANSTAMNRSTLIAVSKWMRSLCPCQVRCQVEARNAILDVDAWIEKRKNDASSPSKTRMLYVVLALSSPCERTATKIKARTGFANGTI